MNGELKEINCKTCSNYADFAYFCMELRRWIFPEDYQECAAYVEGDYMDRHREQKEICT